jgi:predicted  nucleic acid-binding Zn-ribbon protein
MNYQNPVNWTKKDQLNALSEEQKMLKEDLQAIEKEIQDLKGAKK